MELRRYFQFEPKVGWSEIFSLIAMGIAVIALWQSDRANRPQLRIHEMQGRLAATYPAGGEQLRLVGLFPFLIENTGGRNTTLTVLRGSQVTLAVAALLDGELVDGDEDFKVFLVDGAMRDDDLAQLPSKGRRVDLKSGTILDENVPSSGGRVLLYLGIEAAVYVEADVYDRWRPLADQVTMNLELEASDGGALPLRIDLRVPSAPRRPRP